MPPSKPPARTYQTEILVAGGGLGGVSAALSALRLGRRVILTEKSSWLGGQLTSQGVPFDEGPWAEQVVQSRSFWQLREGIRQFYRDHYPLTAAAHGTPMLNPGQGNIGTLCHEPRVAVQVIEQMLAPYRGNGQLTVLLGIHPIGVEATGDRVDVVTFEGPSTDPICISAQMVIDATETGDLLALGNIEHVLGAESRADTGELHAVDGPADPHDQQAMTWGLAIDYLPGEDHTIEKPNNYQRYRDLRLDFWPGPQFGWTVSDHVSHKPLDRVLFAGDTDAPYLFDLWHARRIAYRRNFEDGRYRSDITIANWPQMDYWLKPGVSDDADMAAAARTEAAELSLSFLYWMQTEAPRHDGGHGYAGLRPRGDVLGTTTGLAMEPYYREGRRIQAEFTVLEEHIGVEARPGQQAGAVFADSVGIGAYRIDLHPNTRANRNTVDIDCFPFQIPLGALLPVRMDNLVPACKNIGTTRITNGAYRVHPVEWSIGEAAGALAATALDKNLPPRAIRNSTSLLEEFQATLARLGVLLNWPSFGALTPRTRTGYRPPAD